MKNRLTGAQMQALKPYERNIQTALASDYTRGLGRVGVGVFSEILASLTGKAEHFNYGCPNCVLNLVRTVGRVYMETLKANQAKTEKKAARAGTAKANIKTNKKQ